MATPSLLSNAVDAEVIRLVIVFGHVLLDTVFGWALLSSRSHRRNAGEMLLTSILLGLYVETLLIACLMFLHVPFSTAGIAVPAGMIVVAVVLLMLGRGLHVMPRLEKPMWYEWLVLLVIAEKIVFALWQITRTHTYFDDALTHWSGRARALYGVVNWSWDSASPYFLGGDIGTRSYPLHVPIWRAVT